MVKIFAQEFPVAFHPEPRSEGRYCGIKSAPTPGVKAGGVSFFGHTKLKAGGAALFGPTDLPLFGSGLLAEKIPGLISPQQIFLRQGRQRSCFFLWGKRGQRSVFSHQPAAKRRVRFFRWAVILSSFRGVGWAVAPGMVREVFGDMDNWRDFVQFSF